MQKLFTILVILAFPFFSSGQIFNPSDATICKGGNTSFKSGSLYPTASYKWLMRHKGAWDYLTNTSPFSGATSTTLTLTNVSDTLNGDSFKCEVTFGSSVVGTSKAACLIVTGGSTKPSSATASVNPVDCPGGSTQLSVVGGNLSGASAWKWYAGACGKNAVSNPVKPNVTTTYYVRAEGTCGDTTACVSVTVIVSNTASTSPNSITASPGTICAGQSSTLTVSGGSLGSGAIWKWYSGATCSVLIDSQGVSSLAVSPTSTSSYSVKGDGKCGSTVCKNVSIKVNPLPIMFAGNDTALCFGNSIRLNASSKGSNIYLWSPTLGLNDTTALNPNANPKTTTNYVLSVTDANKCTKLDTVTVKVNLPPTAKINKDTVICLGGKAQLSASGGLSYSWFPASGLDFPNKFNPIAKPFTSTKYTVIVSDKNLCSDSAEIQVSVNPLPKININKDTAICEGESVMLHAEGGINYSWTPGKGLDFSNIANPKATPVSNTAYSVYVTNAFGCTLKDSVRIIVNPYPKADAGSDLVICKGDSVQLSTLSGTGYAFSWKPAASLSSANTRTPKAHPDKTTFYIVTAGLMGCFTNDTVIVGVVNKPVPVFTFVDTVVCKNTSWAQYCLSSTSNNIKWWVNNGTILKGQGTSCIYVHWSSTASSGAVSARDSLKNTPSCPVNITKNVQISGGPAPSPAKVIAKGNTISSGILISRSSPFKFHEWGLESKSTHIEQKSCSGDTLCSYSGGIDTFKNNYWVKVGDDKACLTKSYFNQPGQTNGIEHRPAGNIILFPNPVTDKLTIESTLPVKSVIMNNLHGQMITIKLLNETSNQLTLDMSNVSSGVYFISFKTDNGIFIRKIVKH